MNTFGIDHQPALSVICLREGRGAAARLRSVGDGRRRLVRHADVLPQGPGAGTRVTGVGVRHSAPSPVTHHPAPDPQSAFWRWAHDRLYAYLGHAEPTLDHGYRVVVALQAADPGQTPARVERLCRDAGLTDVVCIAPTDALLCRSLAETEVLSAKSSVLSRELALAPASQHSALSTQHSALAAERIVVAVVVGERTTLVAVYQVTHGVGQTVAVRRAGGAARELPVGQAGWVERLLRALRERLVEPPPPGSEPLLYDAVTEFGARLARARPGEAVEWTGPLRRRLHSPLRLTRAECAAWDEVAALTLALPPAIQEVTAAAGRRTQADAVLLGGVGALWPFAADAVAGRVWRSPHPEEDVARGAAWWPEWAPAFEGELTRLEPAAEPDHPARLPAARLERAGADELPPPGQGSGLRPPWERS